ncbi:type II toxin-antitoxin system TacA family antitoxin [Duganella caerulea]|uniref:type II toxin-antitoxin system TacA family antitoxin n=1 Tax=Duganella caerulea TaxID=2885762 RepID=UPI00403811BB
MTSATVRLDLRLESREKDRIVKAAALRGMTVSAFARDVLLREAHATIVADSVVVSAACNYRLKQPPSQCRVSCCSPRAGERLHPARRRRCGAAPAS